MFFLAICEPLNALFRPHSLGLNGIVGAADLVYNAEKMRVLAVIVACLLVIMLVLPGIVSETPLAWKLLSSSLLIPAAVGFLIWRLWQQRAIADALKQASKDLVGELKKRPLARWQMALTALLFAWGLCYLALIAWRGDPDDWGIFLPLFAWPAALILLPTMILIKYMARQLRPAAVSCTALVLLPFLTVVLMVTVVGLFLIPLWLLVLFFLARLLLLDIKSRRQPD